MTFEEIYIKLKNSMTIDGIVQKRFYHSESVMKKALEINQSLNLGLDEDKVRLAGLLHDCAKLVSKDELINLMIKYHDTAHLDEIKEALPIIHALAGRYYAEENYGITDPEILDAICYHCTGKKAMTTLEEVIFVADYTEDLRKGEFFDKVREALKVSLKAAVIQELEEVMQYFKENNVKVYYLTKDAYDYYQSL